MNVEVSKDKLSFNKIVWLYTLGAIIGFVLETSFHFLKFYEFINKQGMVYGPFKPLYGLGAVLMYVIYRNVKEKRYLFVFLTGILIGTFYEYFISFFEEKVLGYNSWLYPDGPLSINGRIYLPYCLAWGIIILLFYLIIPYLKKWYKKLLEEKWFKIVSFWLCIFMVCNAILTFGAAVRYVGRSNGEDAKTFIGEKIDVWYDDDFMKKHFPKMRVKK